MPPFGRSLHRALEPMEVFSGGQLQFLKHHPYSVLEFYTALTERWTELRPQCSSPGGKRRALAPFDDLCVALVLLPALYTLLPSSPVGDRHCPANLCGCLVVSLAPKPLLSHSLLYFCAAAALSARATSWHAVFPRSLTSALAHRLFPSPSVAR
ncbi:hypothetical protein HPB50_018209 [Hyalomma asiaticum]|uniref:Uncharacterized protein n=1 Tax=Hyalomma asiaticum TaxID=266040 RepID=A0ACB7SIM1_HYAAI|nr:hypothetical protein HPB50_018209 [Hyalomma asiaticum]